MKLLRNPIVLVAIVFVVTMILMSIFIKNPDLSTPKKEITYGEQTNTSSLVIDGIGGELKMNPNNIDYNHDWIIANYNIWNASDKKSSTAFNDNSFISDYDDMVFSPDSMVSDLGHYCIGLYYSLLNNNDFAVSEFRKVKNKRLKYLNNSFGVCYLDFRRYDTAELYFKNEISVNGDLKKAYNNLFSLLLNTKKYGEMKTIFSDKTIYQYINNQNLSEYFFLTNNPVGYIITIVKKIYISSNVYGFTAALLILLCWVFFLRRVDIFEPEKWIYTALTVGCGGLCCLFAFPLYDFDSLKLGFDINGSTANDFFYSIFGIGMIEELVKIIPVLILARFTKLINEPIDYIIYAGFSALGFAFIENLLYFDSSHLYIIHGRAMLSAVGHMFFSSIIGYGLAQQKLFHRINKYLNFLLFYILAACAHGLYDFILTEMSGPAGILLAWLFIGYIFLMISVLNNFINNALNLSSFLKADDSLNLSRLQDILVCSLSAVVLYEYVVLSFKFGTSYSNTQILNSARSNIYLIFFLSTGLSRIDLNKGMWDNPILPKFSRRPGLSYLINKRITILPKTVNNNILSSVLPVTGVVARRLTIGDQSDYLVVKLDSPLNVAWFITHVKILKPTPDYILVKGTDSKRTLTLGYKQGVSFITISELCDPMKDNLTKADVNLIDYAFIG